MSTLKDLYDIRDYVETDKPFVCSTFLKGLYYGNEFYNLIPKSDFMNNYKDVTEVLTSRAVIKIAYLKEDPDVILGYSILSRDYQAIHFCYVKAAWRNKGIGKSLLPGNPTAMTHFTGIGLTLAKKHYPNCVFNPFYKETI